jgi:hypothetical protein
MYPNKADMEVVSENAWKQFRCGIADIYPCQGVTAVEIDGVLAATLRDAARSGPVA